jgi:tetratricopeptide (TPR) repeat protein
MKDNMKSFITLIILNNLLFINNIHAKEVSANACNAAVNQQDAKGALSIAAQLLKQNNKDKDALICQGRALSLTSDLDGAMKSFNAAKLNSKDSFDQIVIHILMGNAYQSANQVSDAISAYQTSADLAKTQKNVNYERISYNFLGDVQFKAQQFPEALNYYTKAYALTANDNERGESYENIALTQYHMGALDEALAYQIKAFVTHEKVGSLDQFANSSITLGDYYRLNKNYIAAENTLNKIIKFAKEQGGAYFEAKASYTLAKVKRDMGDVLAAKKLIDHANKIAQETNDSALLQEIKDATQ